MVVVTFKETDSQNDEYGKPIAPRVFNDFANAHRFLLYAGYEKNEIEDVWVRSKYHSKIVANVQEAVTTGTFSGDDDGEVEIEVPDNTKIRLVYNVQIVHNDDDVLDILRTVGGIEPFTESVSEYEGYVDIESIDDIREFVSRLDDFEEEAQLKKFVPSIELKRF